MEDSKRYYLLKFDNDERTNLVLQLRHLRLIAAGCAKRSRNFKHGTEPQKRWADREDTLTTLVECLEGKLRNVIIADETTLTVPDSDNEKHPQLRNSGPVIDEKNGTGLKAIKMSTQLASVIIDLGRLSIRHLSEASDPIKQTVAIETSKTLNNLCEELRQVQLTLMSLFSRR